ncbi:serine/threonine-protein kinase fray2 [Forsythia ovata]|uniref:Serine/threonine-protein kinase fray2 n=1 Tax=Forsythia ovata TaxID=205694 RepID=A0ABD1R4C8_9LAMI
MEDEKLAAYYDELTQKGGGAARFKQGLGFSSNTSANNAVPARGSAVPATSSFLSNFVKASSPTTSSNFQKEAQLESIQNKLNKAPKEKAPKQDKNSRNSSRRSRSPDRDKTRDRQSRRRSLSPNRHSKLRSPSRSRSRSPVRHSSRRSRSRSTASYSRRRHRSRDRRSRRRSRSPEDHGSRRKHQSRSRSRGRNRERSKRSESPRDTRSEKGKKHGEKKNGGGDGGRADYTKLIEGYDKMTPAERVKAKMKLQLSETAEKDETMGTGSGWERFDFNKDAPLDDEEIEAAEDDAALVKHLGQSFRFSVVEAKKEEDIKAAHDEAMFGASSLPLRAETDDEAEEDNNAKEKVESSPVRSLLSDQVLTTRQGSWRDRARKG